MSIQQHDICSEQRRHGATRAARAPRGARGDPTVWCTCGTATTSSPTGDSVVVLRIAGELDLSTVDFLTTVLTAVVHQRPDHLIVDLAEVSFCGARALAAIAEAGLIATRAGTRFGVSAASALMRRCWAQFWANEQPTQYLTTAAALSAAMAHPAHLPAARDTRIDDAALLCTAGDRGAQRSYATL